MPLISQVLEDTRPMAAEALAPSAPTMAESIYCITVLVMCVKIPGKLSRQISCTCGFSSVHLFPMFSSTFVMILQ